LRPYQRFYKQIVQSFPEFAERSYLCRFIQRWLGKQSQPKAGAPNSEVAGLKSKKAEPQPLQAGDYYFNSQGLMVFTEQYHLRRGYCCGSGCRHCPWRGDKTGDSERPDKPPLESQQRQKKD
jgi:hypothetical protein